MPHDEQRESLVHVWQRPAAAHGQHILASGEPGEPGQPLRHLSHTKLSPPAGQLDFANCLRQESALGVVNYFRNKKKTAKNKIQAPKRLYAPSSAAPRMVRGMPYRLPFAPAHVRREERGLPRSASR